MRPPFSKQKKPAPIAKDLLIYGRRPVLEAIETGQAIEKILFKTGIEIGFLKQLKDLCIHHEIPFQGVPLVKLDSITSKNHQGVIMVLSQIKYYKVEDILADVYDKGELPLFIILDGVTDIHNMGAIARTAWATGAQAIIVPHKGSASLNSEAIKKSAGALLHIPVCRAINFSETVNFLKNNGLNIVSLGLSEPSESLYNLDAKQPLAIIMGNEGEGLSQQIIELSNQIIKIPMVQSFDSYNVSVATAMILYEIMKQRFGTNVL